jgi:alpha-beta hydrolase superfamily lysophospholipase
MDIASIGSSPSTGQQAGATAAIGDAAAPPSTAPPTAEAGTDGAEDVLGADYRARIISLGEDDHGPVTATLVQHLPSANRSRGAVLWVHGWADYFFQTHVAEHFSDLGFAFYALDLRACGRSWREGERAHYVEDLATYDVELDEAARIIRTEHGHRALTVLGHSTGGLVTALWAHRRRDTGVLDALVLNSPWLDLHGSRIQRVVAPLTTAALARRRPDTSLARPNEVYSTSVMADRKGEWTPDLRWKPLTGFPVLAGWLNAILRAQTIVHRGLDLRVPVLVLHSTRSLLGAKVWTPAANRADTILDVAQIAQWSPSVGRQVTVVRVEGALHDVFLSAPEVREQAFTVTDRWLDHELPA